MARARMLSSRVSTDSKVRALPCAAARLLFTWMIAHADNLGRLRGEPHFVRALVIPHEPDVTDRHVEEWLLAMADSGLISLYESDGGQFIQLTAWEKHQRLDRMKRSDFPPPPDKPLAPMREPAVPDREPLAAGSRREVEVEVEGEADAEDEGGQEGERGRDGGRGNGAGVGQWQDPMRASTTPGGSATDAPTPPRSPHPHQCTCEVCFPGVGGRVGGRA